ncbi:endonuclease, partial [Enterococcus faecalis]
MGYLTFREFRPRAVERVAINKQFSEQTIEKHQSISLVTYIIGYAGLGQTEDFFMDGGKTVLPVNKAMVQQNLTGIE